MHPKVADTSATSMTISWGKPAYDGGEAVSGYYIEYKTSDADAEWQKVDNVVAQKVTIEKLDKETYYVCRIMAFNKGGKSEWSYMNDPTKPSDVLIKPDYEIDNEFRKALMIPAGKEVEVEAEIKGRPRPNLKWTYNDKELKNLSVKVDEYSKDGKNFAKFSLIDACRYDSGKYTLSLENSAGSATLNLYVRVLDTPDAPGNVEIKKITNDFVDIAWDTPKNDGHSEVFNYHVEKREVTMKAWTLITSECNANQYRIADLIIGRQYFFRIVPENMNGLGVGAETKEVLIAEEPSPVESLKVIDISNKSISLAWGKPFNNGGAAITGYIVEFREKIMGKTEEKSEWESFRVRHCEAVIPDLKKGKTMEIRVKSVNDVGCSDVEFVAPTKVEELLIHPEADMSVIPLKTVNMRMGGDCRLDVPLAGKPFPSFKLQKDRQPLQQSEDLMWARNNQDLTIVFKNASKATTGLYYIVLENSAGRKEFTFNVNVFGRPGKIDGTIEPTEITHDTITLAWNPPKDNGGADITNYVVERKEIETQNFWYTVNANCNRNICTVRKLNANMDYIYRIYFQQQFGMSEWVESPIMQPRHKFRVPTPPTQPTVDKVKADSMVVSWEAPSGDGGSKVQASILQP
jgi:titin